MDSKLLPYTIDPQGTLKTKGAPKSNLYAAQLKRAEEALAALMSGERLELFTNVEREDDIKAAETVAASLGKNADTVFVFGIGGSSLGGQALLELAPQGKGHPRVVFLDNPDPWTSERAFAAADITRTRFVVISKSGGTAETLAQALIAEDAVRKTGKSADIKNHFAVITEPKPSALRQFGQNIGCAVLDHPLGVGGRYSVLTMVGVLPALLMGLDVRALRRGARDVIAHAKDSGAASGAALHAALAEEDRLHESVLWCYADQLKTFGQWWRQLWAESLGKDGKGSTPAPAVGPVDQHSQLQLFLGGPGKALYTIVDTAPKGQGQAIPTADAKKLGLDYLAGRHLGDLFDAESRATMETLAARGRAVRHIRVPKLDERALGALFMHFMIETILMGRLMGVDPFDQPAVEEGKVLARKYLSEMG